jgi:hypothetical protein
MSLLIQCVRAAWNDHFPGTSPTNTYNSQTYASRHIPSGTSVYVSNCLFESITSSDTGGALYCSNSATYFLIESTSFFSCKTSSSCGAIYFYNSKSCQSILYKVCGYDCCTTNSNSHQFGLLYVYNAASCKNCANFSSIARCVNENSTPHYILAFQCGNVCCPSVNLSLNKCYRMSGITCWPSSDSNYVTCSLTYSSFTDNHATAYNCFWLNTGGANYEMKSCNILRNIQGTLSSHGTIYTSGNLKIDDSCILENTATNTIYQGDSSYTITLSNCTVDKMTCNQNLVTQSTVTNSFILALNHMSTQNCHSKYDSAGTLTPIIQTPSSSKKQRLYFSCERLFHQPQLTFASTFIFIFHFIYPYTSKFL